MNKHLHILIIEDEQIHQEYLLRFLERQGLQADVAGSLQEAVEALITALTQNRPYGLLLLDIMLPDGTGHDLLEQLRNDARLSTYKFNNCRIIMITGMDDLKHIAGAFAEECDAYLTKPVNEAQLVELLHKFHIL
jgi:two-component system chemotaxis response regulator CheY